MPTPASRTPVRIARGTYANLAASLADLNEGEICFATDEEALYVKNGGSLVASGGTSVTTSDTAPSTPSDGDLWYDSVSGRLFIYYQDPSGSQWVDASPQGGGSAGITVSDSAPSTPASGNLWYRSSDGRLYVYYNDGSTSQWVDASPQGGGGSGTSITTGNTTAEVIDTGSDGRFVVTTEGTEALRVDSSRRLLVGTTTARLVEPWAGNASGESTNTYESVGDSAPGAGIALGSSSNTNVFGPYLYLFRSRGGTVGSNTVVASGDNLGTISFAGADGTDVRTRGAAIYCEVDGTPGANDMPGRLIFATTADGAASPTERLRITNDGYALFNTTNKALRDSTSDVGLSIDPGAGGLLQLAAGGPTYFNRVSSDGSIIAFRRNGANVGSISVTGSATAYNTSSDYRLKENVTAVTDGIARLQQLKPSRFNFITDPDTTVDGFIAHEVQAVVPEAIYGEKDATDEDGNPIYQGIDQSKLVPLLTAALQEAVARIEDQATTIASLEARLTALEGGN